MFSKYNLLFGRKYNRDTIQYIKIDTFMLSLRRILNSIRRTDSEINLLSTEDLDC